MHINDILYMLDWNNNIEIQKEGRKMAKEIQCLSIFMQPMDALYNKNIWENCAIILSEKEDEKLTPYLLNLLDWLQDLNWPGAIIIFERLQKFQNYEKLAMAIKNRILMADAIKDQIWLENLSELSMQEEIKEIFDEIIDNIGQAPWQNMKRKIM